MRSYFPVINLLRALAVIMICLYHFTHYQDDAGSFFDSGHWILNITQHGETWVYTFFVISGFVLPLSMSKGQYQLKRFLGFMGRRLVRIELPYLSSMILILLSSLAFAIKSGDSFYPDARNIMAHVLFLVPFTDNEWYNPIYWTLAIEMQFYILIGLIYPFLIKKEWSAILLLIMLGLSGIVLGDLRLLFHYGPLFASGITLYLIMSLKIRRIVGIVLLIIFIGTTWFTTNTDITFVMVLSMFAIAGIEVNKKWINYLGDISYSLYLTHGTAGISLIFLLRNQHMSDINKIFLCIMALAASLIFAHLHWRFVEKPSMGLSRRFRI